MTINRKEFSIQKNDFLNYIQNDRRLAENTQRAYQADLLQCLEYWKDLEIQQKMVISFESILQEYVAMLFNLEINPASIARKISCLNSFKRFLKKQNIIITIKLKRPYIKQKSPESVPLNNIFYLLDQTPDDELPTKRPLRDKAILEFLYATGVRVSELVQIELNNINFKNKSIIIRNKRKKERIVFFGSQALIRIQNYLRFERTITLHENERLFVNYKNEPLTTRSIQRICAMFREFLINKTQLTPCLLRNSFATHMLDKGADLGTVQELLGHKVSASTERFKHS